MQSLINLWSVLAGELARTCHTCTTRDVETVTRRVEDEGLSFLTITLPNFMKDFERSLSCGEVSDDSFLGFKRRAGLPQFLGGFLRIVFDEHGKVRDVSDALIDAVSAVRQLTGLYGKLELRCSDAREFDAIQGYIDADVETGEWDEAPDTVLTDFARISSLLYSTTLSAVEHSIHEGSLVPKHGPGAVADRLRGNAKFDLVYWPQRLENVFSYSEYGIPNARYYSRIDRVCFPPPEEEVPSRVLLVPKTLKTPRVIAAEPTALQWMQQAISQELVPRLESSWIRSMIGFTDQYPNRELARKGSLTGQLATLDMKEASDRVSLMQALALAENFPVFREAISATRSQLAELPDGRRISIRKFASMGSALCFPIEAMAFLAAIFVGIERKLIADGSRTRLTKEDVKSYRGSVRVYGDDIIVPVDCVDHVIDVFSRLGWKTNVNKSHWTGMFRESCGGDYYAGVDVTPIRFRRLFPSWRGDAAEVASLVSFRNQLYWRGYWKTCGVIDDRIRGLTPHYPIVESTSPILGRESVFSWRAERTHPDYQKPLVKGLISSPRIPRNKASEVGALLKCLLSSHDDPKHLTHSGRPAVVDMKLRWSSPF